MVRERTSGLAVRRGRIAIRDGAYVQAPGHHPAVHSAVVGLLAIAKDVCVRTHTFASGISSSRSAEKVHLADRREAAAFRDCGGRRHPHHARAAHGWRQKLVSAQHSSGQRNSQLHAIRWQSILAVATGAVLPSSWR